MSAACFESSRLPAPNGHRRAALRAAAVAAWVAASSLAMPVGAQPAASAWVPVELPGGVAGLRRLLGPSLDASRVFIEAARRIDSPDENEAGVREDLRAYMDAVDELWHALGRLPDGTARVSRSRGGGVDQSATDAVIAALGLQWRGRQPRPVLAVEDSEKAAVRRRVLAWAGIDVEPIARVVNEGGTAEVSLPVDSVPSPLPESAWQHVAFNGESRGGLARAVINDRRASLLAHGLSSLDPQMLTWFTTRPALLRELYREHAGSFAVFGRSLRVAGGRVAPAGGERARNVWERLVGAPTSDPDRFFLALLDRNEGRLAWLYDTVLHLDAPRVAHLLALGADEPARLARTEALARTFAAAERGLWKVEQRPFRRPYPDPALFIREVALDGAGRLINPISRAGWEAVMAGDGTLRDQASLPAGGGAGAAEADVAWLAEQVFAAAPRPARDRYEAVLFAQRVFGSAPPEASGDVIVALRGFLAFPALALTLERMGLDAPGLHAAAARAAARISGAGDHVDRYRLLMQFQGALALVWRLHAVATIDTGAAGRLVSGLLALRVDPKDQFAGGAARWLLAELLPAIGAPPPPAGVEERLLAALSGRRNASPEDPSREGAAAAVPSAGAPPSGAIEWEGLRYVLDLAGADERALRATREAQGAYSLDDVLAIASAGEALLSPAGLDGIARQRTALAAIEHRLPPIRESAGMAPGMALEPARTLARALEELDRVRSVEDLARARNAAIALVRLGDALLADTLAAWTYAVAAIGSDDPGLQTIGLVRRHDLSPRSEVEPERRRGPWRLPRPVPVLEVPWHVAGSLLALDFAFAETRLRRVEADELPSPLAADDTLRFALAQHVVLLDPRRLTDEARETIVTAVSRGRARVADAAAGRAGLDAVAEVAGVSEWRRESIRWLAGADPASAERAFSLGEQLLVGLDAGAEAWAVGAWGPSEHSLTGALRSHLPPPRNWEALAGHRGTGMVAATFMDLAIRVAQGLSRAQLPAALAPAVLAAATWDLCAEVQLASADDWLALVAGARAIPDARFDDYLATLTGEGPLAPAPDAREAVP